MYVSYSNLGTTERLVAALETLLKSFVCIKVLNGNIEAKKRDAWIKKNPCDVLITNPELVKTGLDLFEYPSIFFYQTGYNTFTLKQASRRSWRIGQKVSCKVFFLVYERTPQSVALALMSRKIKAANLLEGRLVTTENELGAFCNEVSIQDQIAKAILSGDKSDDSESPTNEWVFVPREWNAFEALYNAKKEKQPKIKVAHVSSGKDDKYKTHSQVKKSPVKEVVTPVPSVSLFDPSARVNVTIYKGKKAQVVEMSGEDIIKKLESENNSGIQLSLF